MKVFGIRLASKVPHGIFDATVHPLIKNDPMLSRALLPLLEARLVLYRTYLKPTMRSKQWFALIRSASD